MPERSNTPPPPRLVARTEPEHDSRHVPRQGLNRFELAGIGVVVLGAALVVGVLISAQRGDSAIDVRTALNAAGCTLHVVEAEDPRPHLTSLDAKVEHNTFPPTNGLHYVIWAPWALYRTPVNQLQAVHNLEHGGIVVQYGNAVSDADLASLQSFYLDDRNALLVAPLPELGDRIALQAWTAAPRAERTRDDFGEGRLALCPGFDVDAFSAFRDAYRYHGLEVFGKALLEPGL